MPQAALPIASLAMGGIGEIGNLTGGKHQAKAANALQSAQANELGWMQNYQNMLANMSPAQMNQMLSQLTQPLNANLTTAVGNAVNPQLAAMGLGQSPGQLAAGMATSLAPYQQQQQQLGAQLMGQKLYGPLQPAESVLNATTNLPAYFRQPQGGAGNMLLQGISGLTGGTGGGGGSFNQPFTLSDYSKPTNYFPTDPSTWANSISTNPQNWTGLSVGAQ